MAPHGQARTILAPPFHSVQMDVVYKFCAKPWKNSRGKTHDIYALVIVCILSSATSILVLEGLETQDVVQALERHSSMYGAPRNVYVDAGSQLINVENVQINIRDLNCKVFDNLGIEVKVSVPKSHEERGRVEAKVKTLRSMLLKLAIKASTPMTTLAWQTLFSKIANDIDNLPICRGNASNVSDFGHEIITPNRLKLGRNNSRSLEDSFILQGNSEVKLLEVNRKCQQTWYQIMLDRLHYLIPKPNKWLKTDDIQVCDVVVFIHNDSTVDKQSKWCLGKVHSVEDSGRRLTIEYFKLSGSIGQVSRNPRQVSKIYSHSEIPVNTTEYYEKNILKSQSN